jgi:ribonuclease E
VAEVAPEPVSESIGAEKPKRSRRKKPALSEAEGAEEPALAEAEAAPEAANDANGGEEGEGPRRGWWQRTFGE